MTETDHDHELGEDDHGDEGGVNVKTFKIIMLFVMLACCFTALIPKAVPACGKNETILSLLNCFSAGIFLSMSLVHIAPEAVEIYGVYVAQQDVERAFPLPYVCFFGGYLLVLLIDRVVARMVIDNMAKKQGTEQKEGGERSVPSGNQVGVEMKNFEGGETEN